MATEKVTKWRHPGEHDSDEIAQGSRPTARDSHYTLRIGSVCEGVYRQGTFQAPIVRRGKSCSQPQSKTSSSMIKRSTYYVLPMESSKNRKSRRRWRVKSDCTAIMQKQNEGTSYLLPIELVEHSKVPQGKLTTHASRDQTSTRDTTGRSSYVRHAH